MGLVDQIIGVESGGNPNATNPSSSASGLGQFIDSTWLNTIKSARPDLAQGKSDADLLALKTDPQLSREMTEAYANQNQAILSKAGVPVTPGSTYLAHFAGPQGAIKILQADPDAPIGGILGQAAVKANPFMANMTARDLQAWADRKMGGLAAQPQNPAPASPAASPVSLPATALNAPPVFAPPAQSQQQQADASPSYFSQVPAEQAPSLQPIFYAPRRSPSIAQLKSFRPYFGKS